MLIFLKYNEYFEVRAKVYFTFKFKINQSNFYLRFCLCVSNYDYKNGSEAVYLFLN